MSWTKRCPSSACSTRYCNVTFFTLESSAGYTICRRTNIHYSRGWSEWGGCKSYFVFRDAVVAVDLRQELQSTVDGVDGLETLTLRGGVYLDDVVGDACQLVADAVMQARVKQGDGRITALR